jgi:putative peptidoglycan lipid II flippase
MNVGRTALLLLPVALVARGVGFVVPIVIAGWFGVRPETDAFFFALSVPSVLLVIASNAMGTVVVPQFAQLRTHAPHRLPPVVAGATIASALIAMVIAAVFATISPALLPRFTSFDASTQALAVRYAWMLLPFVGAVGALSVLRAACEGQGSYRLAGLSPILRSGALIAIVTVNRGVGPDILPVALDAGAVAEAFWLLGVLVFSGVRPSIPAWPSELAEAARAFGPVLVGEAMVALNLVVDKGFAAGLPEGSVTMLEYADRARLIPQTLLEASLLAVVFQAWAKARAEGDAEARARGARTALRWVFLLAPPALGGMVVGREALARILFGHGVFPDSAAPITAAAMAAFVPGIFASLLGALLVKAHVVEGRYGFVMRLGFVSIVTNALLNALLRGPLGLTGLAMSTSLTTALITVISWRRLGTPLPGRDALGVLAASTVLALTLGRLDIHEWDDPRLWAAAVPFLALLGFGGWRARRVE